MGHKVPMCMTNPKAGGDPDWAWLNLSEIRTAVKRDTESSEEMMEHQRERNHFGAQDDIADGTTSPIPASQANIVFRIPWPDHDDDTQEPGSVTIDTSAETIEDLHEEFDIAALTAHKAQCLNGVKIENPLKGDDMNGKKGNSGRSAQKYEPGRHPKGTYFRDEQRVIDYVLVYEERSHRHNLTHTVHDLRRLALSSSHTVMTNLRKLSSISGHLVLDQGVVPPVHEPDDDQRRDFFLGQLLKAGLEMEMHEYHETGQKDRKLVFVKIHAPCPVLLREAERLRMKLPLKLSDPQAPQRKLDTGKRRGFDFSCSESRGAEPFDDPVFDFDDHIAWPFSNDQIDRFDLPKDPESLFKPCRRSEIVWEVLQLARNDPRREKRRGIESLLERGIFEAAFPLHDGDYEFRDHVSTEKVFTTRQRLHAEWATIWAAFRPQPLNRIRNYFSEKVAFYFAFMDFYLKMLLIPSIFGMIAFFYGLIISWTSSKADLEEVCDPDKTPGKYIMCPICQPPACDPYRMAEEGCQRAYWQYRLDNVMAFVTASLNILWCAFFVKFWRRREARLAAEWDTHDAQEGIRVIRPDYEKKATRHTMNAVTGEVEPHVPKCRQVILRVASIVITCAILCTAVSCLAVLIMCRVAMYGMFKKMGGVFREHNIDMARWIQHGFMFIMITAFETVYHRVAQHLTKMECPKTTSGYLSSLLWKVFIFAHLVDFLPIAYAAWLKGRIGKTPQGLNAITEMCEAGGCMNEVVELVAVLLLLRLIVQNLAEVGWPALKAAWARFRTKRRGVERTMQDSSVKHVTRWSQFLKDYHLNELTLDGVSPEYMEMMIQFSFVAFFTPALPLVPLICLINNIAEIRIDAINFLASHRRPSPVRVPGIQIWNKFMDIILKLAVVVNAALLSFTSEIIPRLYHDQDYRHPHNRSFAEYITSSLSWQPVHEWKEFQAYVEERQRHPSELGAQGGEYIFQNLTHCAYFGHRAPEAPHALQKLFFQIMAARLVAFSVFILVFYLLIYLINAMINDVPKDVRHMIQRRQYIVTKALEEEAFRRRATARDIGDIFTQVFHDTARQDSINRSD